jgi:hypothetical protein
MNILVPGTWLLLSIDNAQARAGWPLTPVSVADARRTTRRAVVGGAVVGATHCARVLVNGSYVCR